MVVAVELRGMYRARIFRDSDDQLARMLDMSCPELIAFCLMGTHVHLVLEVDSEDHANAVVRRIANRHDRTAAERGVAMLDEPHLQVLADDYAVFRYVAYAHANPVKAEMVADPLGWAFSSHRDVCGMRKASWYSADRILALMGRQLEDASGLHDRAGGRLAVPGLVEPVQGAQPAETLVVIAHAVAGFFGHAQLHETPAARRCFASVARFEAWPTKSIAAHMGKSIRQVNRLPAEDTPAVRAVLAMLRDPRLRPTGAHWWVVPAEARGPNLWLDWRAAR